MNIDITWMIWAAWAMLLLWVQWQVVMLAKFYTIKPRRLIYLDRLTHMGVCVLIAVALCWAGLKVRVKLDDFFALDIPQPLRVEE